MLLKYNISNIKKEKRRLNIVIDTNNNIISDNGDYHSIILTTNDNHKLNRGDTIIIEKTIGNETYVSSPINVENDNFTEDTFTISYQKYNTVTVDEMMYSDDFCVFRVKNLFKQEELKENTTINLFKRVYSYHLDNNNAVNEQYYEVNFEPSGHKDFIGYETVKYINNIYKWKYDEQILSCEYLGNNYFKHNSFDNIFIDDELYIEDIRFVNKNIINGVAYYKLCDGISFYEYNESIKVPIPLVSSNSNELNDENIVKTYFDERRKELIPDILDYEKKCFIPTTENGYVNKITYNLFLRDRENSESWSSNDAMGWNQYQMTPSGTFNVSNTLTNGDLLKYLNFTDDDIFYQKNKVGKSFLRLSFYNSKNPLDQMLLFYSTIFLNSGELYTKYVKHIDKKQLDNMFSIVGNNTFGEDNLTLSFSASDRFDKHNSSEGYYIYLYPDALKNTTASTIYMKAEFNHAGYGKTIPLMCPIKGNTILNFNNSDFPTSFINSTGTTYDLSTYYDNLYVPIILKKNKKHDGYDYVYSFDELKFNQNSNDVVINLYEPKINDLT